MWMAFQQFWAKGIAQKLAVVAVGGALILCSCCSALIVLGAVIGSSLPEDTATGQNTSQTAVATHATATAPRTSPPTATLPATLPPTAASIPQQPTATTVPTAASGPPRVGSSLSDIVAAYGQPFSYGIGNSPNFYADSAQTIIVNVTVSGGTVTQVNVLGPTDWTDQQTFEYCTTFLPSDATAYNSVGHYTDFHSSIGDLVIENLGMGTCLAYFAGR